MASKAKDDDFLGDDELAGLFRPFEGRRLALAVSGGVDSMVLMHLVAGWLTTSPGREWAAGLAGIAEPGTVFQPRAERPIGLPARVPACLGRAEWIGGEQSEPGLRLPAAPVVVLTVDHGLRPESACDAQLVAAAAGRLGFSHQTLVWRHAAGAEGNPDDETRAAPPTAGIQEKARAARYALLADRIEAETWALFEAGAFGCSPLSGGHAKRAIVTAHHRDDLVETFLMRLKRGSGLDGLASIRTVETLQRRPVPERPYPSEVDLLRPLLDVPKSRLVATAKHLGLAWAEDPSNADRRFERVRQRRDMAALAALGFEAPAMHLTIRRLQRASDFVEARMSEQLCGWLGGARQVDLNGGLFATIGLSAPAISMADIGSARADVDAENVQRLLQYAIAVLGGGEGPPGLRQIEELRRHFSRVARLDSPGGETAPEATERTLAGCRLDFQRSPEHPEGRIRVWREAGRTPFPELMLEPGDGAWWDDRFAVSLASDAPGPVRVRALGHEGWACLKRRVPALTLWRGIPPGAAATLPAIWRDGHLVAVPYFEQVPDSVPGWLRREIDHEWEARSGLNGLHYRAQFAPVARGH